MVDFLICGQTAFRMNLSVGSIVGILSAVKFKAFVEKFIYGAFG